MTVGVGYLPTPEGRAALGHAIRECTVRDDDLVVVVSAETAERPDWAADLELARASMGSNTVIARTVSAERDAAAELVDLSYEDDLDLLVIGLRRRSPVGKLVMGSTSQRVLLDARCPVTAVKPPVVPASEE
ncbi:MAG: universal stress protein [Actinomycetota bacterium]|nr:universal stress protein [Actinomycetota bacterium]